MPTEPTSYSYPRYLDAKASVDERSLHGRVWQRFVDELCSRGESVRIFEMGGGIGTTARRVIDAVLNRCVRGVEYILVDRREENVAAARKRLRTWGRDRGFDVTTSGDRLRLRRDDLDVSIQLVNDDVLSMDPSADATYDAIVAQAVLDLVHIPTVVRHFRARSHDGTLWYLPIHFDGETVFEPVINPDVDQKIICYYHDSMYHETPYGMTAGARTGRSLFQALPKEGVTVMEAGPSDWIVYSSERANYPYQESYFLHHILHFIESELSDCPDILDAELESWLGRRRRQIDDGELVYIAHQIDVLGTVEGPSGSY